MKKYKIKNRSPKISHACVPFRRETIVLLIAIIEAVLCFVFGKQR
jgi:hypothetical protein